MPDWKKNDKTGKRRYAKNVPYKISEVNCEATTRGIENLRYIDMSKIYSFEKIFISPDNVEPRTINIEIYQTLRLFDKIEPSTS